MTWSGSRGSIVRREDKGNRAQRNRAKRMLRARSGGVNERHEQGGARNEAPTKVSIISVLRRGAIFQKRPDGAKKFFVYSSGGSIFV